MKLRNWLAALAVAFTVAVQAQPTPYMVLDYTEADEWHVSYLEDDEERNSWQVDIKEYTRTGRYFYRNSTPQWSSMIHQKYTADEWGGTYVTEYDGDGENPFPDFTPFYFEPEYYTRECMALDEEGEPWMGSTTTVKTEFEIWNDILREPQAAKNRSTEFTAKILWQWIPVDGGCGEDGQLATQLSSASYTRDGRTGVATPNQQARIVTFIAGRFPSNNP